MLGQNAGDKTLGNAAGWQCAAPLRLGESWQRLPHRRQRPCGETNMRLVSAGLAAILLSGCVMPGIPGMGGATGMGSNPEEAARMSASMQQAQAAGAAQASRPGDDKMDCAAIQAELMAQMQDPNF